jgi:hypothetical protein
MKSSTRGVLAEEDVKKKGVSMLRFRASFSRLLILSGGILAVSVDSL